MSNGKAAESKGIEMQIKEKLLGLSRRQKRLLQVFTDVFLIWGALWLAFILRLGSDYSIEPLGEHFWLFFIAPIVAVPLFIYFGM